MTIDSVSSAPPTDPHALGASLAPVLGEACEGSLSEITWFRTDWQRSGAATGTAGFHVADGGSAKVVVKLPVVQRELLWLRRLQGNGVLDAERVVPRLYASGQELGGYDLAWLVIEYFEHGPLGVRWHDDHVSRMAAAAARFHAAASAYAVDQPPRSEPWDDLVREAQHSLKINDLPRRQEWRTALKALRGRLGRIIEAWEQRDTRQWLHGDLHLANAMSRVSLDAGPVCLIDLAEVHAGHWVEDAIYLERQLWARPERLKVTSPVKAIAAARREQGLPVEEGYPRLAMIRRALLAGTAPRFLKSEGDPRYLESCLGQLQKALKELK